MTNPLYSVGQDVAVCAFPDFGIVIPKTRVIQIGPVYAGQRVRDHCNFPRIAKKDLYTYLVEGCEYYIDERYLRPINPDTEYLEDEITISNGEKTQ